MGPSDVDIVRVFPRTAGGVTAESALPFNADFEVVVEVEAGSAIFNLGTEYAVSLIVRDLQTATRTRYRCQRSYENGSMDHPKPTIRV